MGDTLITVIAIFLAAILMFVFPLMALSERTDDELSFYFEELMCWLQDMNWPGAFCILERVKKYEGRGLLMNAYTNCLKCAKALDDETWEDNLKMIFE